MGASPDPAAACANRAVPAILQICDGLLGEVGRRSHLFAWLRSPGSGPGEWLAVDAYYPANRLVVVCREHPGGDEHLYAELVPAHGLALLALAPSELGADPEASELADPDAIGLALSSRIAELDLPPRPIPSCEPESPSQRPRDGAIARVAASLAQATVPDVFVPAPSAARAAATERATRFAAAHRDRPAADTGRRPAPAPARRTVATLVPYVSRRPAVPVASRALATVARERPRAAARGRPARQGDAPPAAAAVGLILGLALAAVLSLELYAGVGRLALGGGHVLLGFGIALDGCSRVLGTVAARRSGELGWAWGCVLFGCPAVAAFAMFGPDGPVTTEPAPLAGLVAVLAGLLLVAAVLINVLGS